MKRDVYWRTPKKARAEKGKAAWWYANKGSIYVVISGMGTTLECTITRSALARYLKRSDAAGGEGK